MQGAWERWFGRELEGKRKSLWVLALDFSPLESMLFAARTPAPGCHSENEHFIDMGDKGGVDLVF